MNKIVLAILVVVSLVGMSNAQNPSNKSGWSDLISVASNDCYDAKADMDEYFAYVTLGISECDSMFVEISMMIDMAQISPASKTTLRARLDALRPRSAPNHNAWLEIKVRYIGEALSVLNTANTEYSAFQATRADGTNGDWDRIGRSCYNDFRSAAGLFRGTAWALTQDLEDNVTSLHNALTVLACDPLFYGAPPTGGTGGTSGTGSTSGTGGTLPIFTLP